MNKLILGLLLSALWLAHPATAGNAPGQAPGFYVANWNVENLFDTVDDPVNEYDDEFLPNSPITRWTPERLETKLVHLARVISGMNRGQGPDILGIEEVEHEGLIRQLLQKISVKSYGIAYAESPDPRGIDTALIYNRALFSLVESQAYEVPLRWNGTTRDILHAELQDRQGQTYHVLVNHWPSRGGGTQESDPNRFAAARILSQAVGRIFRSEPAARIIVLGDFNDEPSSRSIRVVLNVSPYPSRAGYATTNLYNLSSRQSAKGLGTYFHSFRGDGEWRMFDQIIVSGSLLNNARIEYDVDPMVIDRPGYMVEAKGESKGAPLPTYVDRDQYRGGFSDHLPVGVRFLYP